MRTPLQRALLRGSALYRALGVVYSLVLAFTSYDDWTHPLVGALCVGVVVLWSVVVVSVISRSVPTALWPRALWHGADLALALGLVLASRYVEGATLVSHGNPTLPTIWATAPVISLGIWKGPWFGLVSGLVIAAADVLERGALAPATLNGGVLVLITGGLVGYLARLGQHAEQDLALATELTARAEERQRLEREIHDSALQTLAFIARRGREEGGVAAELADLATVEERRLRSLVSRVPLASGGERDLAEELSAHFTNRAQLSLPAEPVVVGAEVATAVLAALEEGVLNVQKHAPGASAFLLLEDDPSGVTVTLRDDGPGIDEGRLAEAAASGRMGVSRSIVERMDAVGGTAVVSSWPGEGCEVEIHVPR